jgi:hypothetical protein
MEFIDQQQFKMKNLAEIILRNRELTSQQNNSIFQYFNWLLWTYNWHSYFQAGSIRAQQISNDNKILRQQQ